MSKQEQEFREFLNGYGIVKIGEIELEPAEVLEEMDPTAYHEAFLAFSN